MNGSSKHFDTLIEALKNLYWEVLHPIEERAILKNWWSFGGGTALAMFHFGHRKSFDIDIFISESQVFDFLNPKWYIDESRIFDTSMYKFDAMNHHIQLKTRNEIKVDFLLHESMVKKPLLNQKIALDFPLYYESVEDIIGKKIKWRKEDNLTRDIFDLAVAIHHDANIVKHLVESRFITYGDIEKLFLSLEKLDRKKYLLELEKIEPQGAIYQAIAPDAKSIIQDNIARVL